jgi:type II secretory pathway component PulF
MLGIVVTALLWYALWTKVGPLSVILAIIFYGLVIKAFVEYRFLRRTELRYALATAAEAQAPLAPAIWAYVNDRPGGFGRRVWEAVLLNSFIVGYYFTWHRTRSFDNRVRQLAELLEMGCPLSEALRESRVAPRGETVLAAAVGEATGDLPRALRVSTDNQTPQLLSDSLPRLVYPVLILVAHAIVLQFLLIFIMPKYEKIMIDFRVRNDYSQSAFAIYRVLRTTQWVVPVVMLVLVALAVTLILSRSSRWYFPGSSWFYRRYTQGRLLRMLGLLLDSGKTAPQALAVLSQSNLLGGTVQRRLRRTLQAVRQGQPLADELVRSGLLPRSMVGLFHAAERARNLPWALREMGDHLIRRATQLWNRFTMLVGPLLLLIVGSVVAVTALAAFLPMISILTDLTR